MLVAMGGAEGGVGGAPGGDVGATCSQAWLVPGMDWAEALGKGDPSRLWTSCAKFGSVTLCCTSFALGKRED